MSWHTKALGDVITLQRGFDLPKQDRRPGTVPIVSSSGVSGTHDEARVAAPGVVTGRYGSIGQVHFIESDFWPLNTTLFVKDFKGNLPRFISYLLRTINFVSCSDKSSVPGVNRNDLHRLRVAVPGLPEQRHIAETLGALDDKIELNHRMTRTLESIARAIFKSWFVHFDPVRKTPAGEIGLRWGRAAGPSESIDDESNPPDGWFLGTLGQLTQERLERVGNTVEPVVLSAISSGHVVRSDDHFRKRVYSKDVSKYKTVLKNDFAYNPSRINIGSVGLLHDDLVGAVSPVYVVFTPKPGYEHFIDFYLRQASTRNWIVQLSSGSVRQSLSYEDLASIPVIIPTQEVVTAFNKIALQVRSTLAAFDTESSRLEGLRDELLPRLMSGQVRLCAAELYVGQRGDSWSSEGR